jgi:Ca-activated chloride channel family protein
LNPGGGTEIYRGLLAGLEQLRAGMSSDSINHVILLTDGRTYGDEEFALTEARRAAAEGLGISALVSVRTGTMHFWIDWHSMGASFPYIHSPSQLRSILRDHIQGLSSAVARRVQLRANLAPYVHLRAVQRAAPYMEVLESTPDHVVSLGNLTVGEPLSVVWELTIDRQDAGERRILRFDLEAEDSASSTPIVMRRDVTVTFAPDVEPAPVPPRLLNALQRLSVFQLQERAWHALELVIRGGPLSFWRPPPHNYLIWATGNWARQPCWKLGVFPRAGTQPVPGARSCAMVPAHYQSLQHKFGGKDDS